MESIPSFNSVREEEPVEGEVKAQEDFEGREGERFPSTLYHGSNRKLTKFRNKGKRQSEELRAQGRKCVYLHEDRDVARRKYAKEGGYLYELEVGRAKNYGEAIRDEGLHTKKNSMTEGVWIALPRDITVIRRWKINSDGSETIDYERSPESES